MAAALFLEKKQLLKSGVWTCQQHPREPATPPTQRPGKWIVNVTELNLGDLVSLPASETDSKEMQKCLGSQRMKPTRRWKVLRQGLGRGSLVGLHIMVQPPWKAPPFPSLLLPLLFQTRPFPASASPPEEAFLSQLPLPPSSSVRPACTSSPALHIPPPRP